MKYRYSVFLGLVVVAAIIAVAFADCDCDYHPGGCSISKAASEGHKCRCSYRGFWTCKGYEVQCSSWEKCPGNCKSRECCAIGGGDCGAY